MDTADKLTEIFKTFPGIGERQARRFVYFLMARNPKYIDDFSKLLLDLQKGTGQCQECFRFFVLPKNADVKICNICTDQHTDATTLLVVERDSDLESIRKSETYTGKFFVLGGLVPIVEKNTGKLVRINELKNRVKAGSIKEIILAFTLSPQGDHTDLYIRSELKDLGVKISSLGRGLSTGTELEYSDNDTIRNALKNRQ